MTSKNNKNLSFRKRVHFLLKVLKMMILNKNKKKKVKLKNLNQNKMM